MHLKIFARYNGSIEEIHIILNVRTAHDELTYREYTTIYKLTKMEPSKFIICIILLI